MKVAQDFNRPALRRLFSVAGRLLLVEFDDVNLESVVDALFAEWQLTRIFGPHPSDVAIKFNLGSGSPRITPRLHRYQMTDGARCYT
ncbi:MAG: hypothetical protein ABR555_20045, partial [Pyrinomonadaceae bacterium]